MVGVGGFSTNGDVGKKGATSTIQRLSATKNGGREKRLLGSPSSRGRSIRKKREAHRGRGKGGLSPQKAAIPVKTPRGRCQK